MNFGHEPEVDQALPSFAKFIDEDEILVTCGEYCCEKTAARQGGSKNLEDREFPTKQVVTVGVAGIWSTPGLQQEPWVWRRQ